jgi:uncharacterized protein (DUF58 family)
MLHEGAASLSYSMIDVTSSDIQQISHLEFIARQVVEGFITGLHKSPFHGFSVEFAEHRLYNAGESTRHIDWRLFGRSDKLFVKRYEEETNLRCQLVIDTSSSMYFPFPQKHEDFAKTKIGFSIYAAASLILMLQKQRDAFGLSLFDNHVFQQIPAKSSISHSKLLYLELEKLLESGKEKAKLATNAAACLHQIAESIHRRSLVIIFSDMLDGVGKTDELFSALQHLKHNKHEVILFHTVDRSTELDFKFENRPYRFVDLETGEELKLLPNEVREFYTKQVSSNLSEMKLKCGQFNIEFVEADISQGFKQILLPYLIKRGKMRA